MKTYTGTKLLQAEPMTRGAYNEHRGWQLPADENGEDAGYRVVYPDGYQSWSPAPQFEEAYIELPEVVNSLQPHQVRVVAEKAELDSKIRKLGLFIDGSPKFAELHSDDRQLLLTQHVIMSRYSDALNLRISRFEVQP